jgi:hypothetical protein
MFHELTCAAHEQQARDGFPGIKCRYLSPAQILARLQVTRDIIAGCERQLRMPGGRGARACCQLAPGYRRSLGTIVLCYELTPRVAGAAASVTESQGKELEGYFRAIGVDPIANYAN